MVSITTANNALKEAYVGVVANQLNLHASPLLAQIKRSNKNIYGKEIVKMTTVGVNGGIGACSETGALPASSNTNYIQFRSTLKNLYGQLEISDKAIKSSANSIGSFVDLLAYEMENLVKSSSFNLARMIYGDGSGIVSNIQLVNSNVNQLTVDTPNRIIEGMYLEVYRGDAKVNKTIKVIAVDRNGYSITYDPTLCDGSGIEQGDTLYVRGSKDLELTGINYLFNTSKKTIYGVNRENIAYLMPYYNNSQLEVSEFLIQEVIDMLEDKNGSPINFISCSTRIRRAYQKYLSAYRRNVDVMELNSGFKAITHNGIPLVADRFVEDKAMYFLNTDHFTLHELDDWKWLEDEQGKILRQNPGHATFTATLVKYAELMCDKPGAQGKLYNLLETVTSPTLV